MTKHSLTTSLATNRLILAAAVIWVIVMAASLAWNWHQVNNITMSLAENEARAYFEKDVVYRHWAAMHGGVYVQPTETTPPHPYLEHIFDRDVVTTTGKELTLINPAYMTRQVHELGLEQYDMLGNITSLDPLRPENAPDEWEAQALLSFEQGADRTSSVETMDGRQYLRFMKPLVTQENCLGCHGHQGYAVGDIHGGISVSVPWEPYLAQSGEQKTGLVVAHALIGVLGLLGLRTGQRLLRGSELKLLESREQTASTLHSIGEGVISCDRSGRIQDMNPAAENLTSWNLDECRGRRLEEVCRIVTLQDHGQEENPVSRVLQQGQAQDLDTHSVLISRDGRKVTIKQTCSPIKDSLGSITGAVLVFRDVTGEHTANLLTRKRLELYEYAQTHSLDELMTRVLDDAEVFVDSSIGFFHFVEKDQKTISLQNWSTRSLMELCHIPGNKMHCPIDQAGVWVQAALEKRPVIHNDYESMPDKKGLPEGHAKVIREVVVPVIRNNKVVAIMGLGNKPAYYDEKDVEVISFFADVTWDLVQQKRTQEALQNSEARLKTITDAAQDAIIMMDAQGIISYWNPAAENILGYTWDEAMGRDLHQLIMPSRYTEAFQASFPDFQKTGRGNAVGRTIELYARTKNGREIPVELALSSVFIHGQWHAIGIARDITEKKQAREELHRNAKNLEIKNAELDAARIKAEEATRAKSEFLANMSHEIRTPMNGVIGMTGLLMDTDLDDEQRHYARTVRSSAQSLLTVINDILDFSKIEAGRLDIETIDFDLEAMLRDFSGMMAVKAEEKGLELICAMDPDVPSLVRGDPGRLRQILMNLVGNAVKFTEEGEVEIRVQKEKDDAGMLAYWDAGMPDITLRFSVRDTGIGIPEDKQDRLFESFSQVDASTTRKFGGTGLGLAISRQLAELMGGEVGLDSQEGQGSTFWFTVTLELQENQHQNRLEPACLEGVRVLIVDDNPTNREILMVRLGSWEMRPEEASSGPEALRMLHKAHADNDPFVVAVLDMQMPDMDGETLGRSIKQDGQIKDARLIMMSSATGQTGDSSRLQKAGFDIILHKPVLPSELHASLEKVLTRTDAADMVSEFGKQEKFRQGYPDFSSTKVRILVAEDNVVNQQVALGILKKMGLRADAVANGREALNALQTIPYDLVLMDVQMPEMDGLAATREIRIMMNDECRVMKKNNVRDEIIIHHSSFRIPIIALTAGAMHQDREQCFEAGMDDYLAKPINPVELARVLDRWLMHEDSKAKDIKTESVDKTACITKANEKTPSQAFDYQALFDRMGQDHELAMEIINMYLQDVPAKIDELQKVIEAKDLQKALRIAHSIKGNSVNTGCMAMAETAGKMEAHGQAGELDEIEILLPELEKQFELCKAEMEKILKPE